MINDIDKINIHHDTFSSSKVYDAEKVWMQLKTHNFFEIGMVTNGCGVHLVLDQAIPCKTGDIFITPPNIPHRFFIENDGDNLTVRRITFCFESNNDENNESPSSLHSCYGLFTDGSLTAYAMLNRSMQDKIRVLYDAIEYQNLGLAL